MKKQNHRQRLLIAAVAGIAMGASLPASAAADEKKDEVKCYGINGCGSHAKCSVSQADLDAVRKLLGEKEYANQFGKSEAHGCGGHAKCGAGAQILNWVPTTAQDCRAQNGIVIEEVGGKKVAKKA